MSYKKRKIKEQYTETNTYFYQKDHLGSIIAITDENGTMVEEYAYDIFGKPYSINEEGKITRLKKSPVGNTRMYTGREYDRGLKLYYNRARYYDPKLARFISRDPIDIADDVNLYAYVGNNSVMFVDLTGTEKAVIYLAKDKEVLGSSQGSIYKAARLQYQILVNRGYKEDDIYIEYGNTVEDFVNDISKRDYKNISLIAHGNTNAIDLDGTLPGSISNVIYKDTLSELPKNLGEDVMIELISCHTGNGDDSIAAKISEQMGVTVKAPETFISVSKDGYFKNSGDNFATGFFVHILNKKAVFNTFNP